MASTASESVLLMQNIAQLFFTHVFTTLQLYGTPSLAVWVARPGRNRGPSDGPKGEVGSFQLLTRAKARPL